MTSKTLQDRVLRILKNTEVLFLRKNQQYATEDALSNFTLGGALLEPEADLPERQYEALKAYMAKHVAHVYGQPLTGKGVRESWQDIVVYGMIALAMLEDENEG